MKTKSLFLCIVVLFVTASCNQDPIFYTISTEPALKEAYIKGTPSNMVVFEREYHLDEPPQIIKVPILYVGSERLNWYAKRNYGRNTPQGQDPGSSWNNADYRIPQPGERIIQLAATENYLYALWSTRTGSNRTISRIGSDDDEWTRIDPSGYPLQTIYSDPVSGRLFAGAGVGSSNNSVILYLYEDDSDSDPDNHVLEFRLLKSATAVLSGTAFVGGSHYLSTRGSGIFRVEESVLDSGVTINESHVHHLDFWLEPGSSKKDHLFMGMIRLEDSNNTIIAIERNGGTLYKVDTLNDLYEQIEYTDHESNKTTVATGRFATGALALWENPGDSSKKLLVAGRQGSLVHSTASSIPNGYVEFDLDDNDSLKIVGITETDLARYEYPRLKSVDHNDRYIATIGPVPINHLLQAPEEVSVKRTFFASTQNEGLWSYRDVSGVPQWNAETN
ncbi:MAG: hypothetical protein FWG89_02180 [Treponema sp.]|nr:hypothetical protein [Treponema sp.]